MKTHHPKLKTQPRPFFSCGFFRHCTQTTLSPTTPHPPSLPLCSTAPPPLPPSPPPPPPPPPPPLQSQQPLLLKSQQPESSSSSSSSTTSQSFTQWKFPLVTSPLHPESDPQTKPDSTIPLPPPINSTKLQEVFHAAELQLSGGSEHEKLASLHLLERSLVPNPPSHSVCPPQLMRALVANLKNKAGAKPATKILLALCLAEANRHVAVEAGAVGTIIEVVMELEAPAAERALAALELTCTVEEGAAELRTHALAVPVMVAMMGKVSGRGKEYAISALAVVYGGGGGEGGGGLVAVDEEVQVQHAPPEEVARAVVLALQGDCTARGRRKGHQLLKALEEYGRYEFRLQNPLLWTPYRGTEVKPKTKPKWRLQSD
ncbi:conserved hypothetical protein [Ricinus communis]|uniref:U-box domain-containing protein n=1 Tax=Ricinus communis TaxID=3988 RepID=B9RS36_RICCO|nr:conserved hypothetical protein [Ricinus communis]